ncbi:hypothetical protein CDL12_12554 [Handroanthus impetiginosus]|uniref:Uncharacterized protein n=1 Tax=Handroanthus impetiginosus TaxID=429701 RepID=A0A2G9HBC3_9LAMI|nr:hypothetical protein CDL12_12554 [Handroanthus impetiginosus]
MKRNIVTVDLSECILSTSKWNGHGDRNGDYRSSSVAISRNNRGCLGPCCCGGHIAIMTTYDRHLRDDSKTTALNQLTRSYPNPHRQQKLSPPKPDPSLHESVPKKNINDNESKQGFWGALTQKTKEILGDDNEAPPQEMPKRTMMQTFERANTDQLHNTYNSSESRKTESSSLQKGLGAIVSSLSQIGGTIGNALEEGITAMENRTADIIQETRKIHIGKKSGSSVSQNQASNLARRWSKSQVAMAMAAKAKLLRELKTVKADLAFAKQRCVQLEEENGILRESHEKGNSLEDDDLVRLQLETLLAEKARLAQENLVCAQENRYLREIVEYHQLTMQDVVYLDECSEEVTEVYPIKTTATNTNPQSIVTVPTVPKGAILQNNQKVSPMLKEASKIVNPYIQMPAEDLR